MKVSEPDIVVNQRFDLPAKTVWNAITSVNEMRQWFFDNIPAFEPEVGFKTEFTVTNEHRIFPHLWEITEVIPLQKIVYNWKYKGYKGDSFVIFEIAEINQHVILTLTTKVVDDFPEDIPEFKRESCVAGWNYFLKNSLVNYLTN